MVATSGAGKALRVFLSHTSELRAFPTARSFVAAAEEAVVRAGHAVIDMAYFAARDAEPADYCVARVRDAQIYVGIIGFRYGVPVRDRPDQSYTQLEFETATRLGLPRLIFIIREQALPPTAGEPAEYVARQAAFRRRLLDESGVMVAWVGSPAELELGLLHALVELGSRTEATATAIRTLPRDVTSFTGRQRELDRLLASILDRSGSARAFGISAIDGMAGVGKTAFAIHAAHRLAPRFPDGQLFLDLHAHTAGQRPVTPADALAALLLSIGVGPQMVPPDVDGRAALWRDHLAGRRMLILLDNAVGAEQVRPLLPGASGCLVLITSRRRLAALEDVDSLTLGALPYAQAAELFIRLAGAYTRDAEPDAVAELVELCGHLPLAIGLLAGRLRSHSTWTVRYLTDTLREAQDRLAELHAEDIAVSAAFNLSYQDLTAEQQLLFRRLGLHPGREIDAHATAALCGIDLPQARRRLDALYNDHLIDEPLLGRYRFHDLIRVYARNLASRDDPDTNRFAVDRLLDYYLYAITSARPHVALRPDATVVRVAHAPSEIPNLTTRQRALAWMDAEWPNLSACLDHAAASDRHEHVYRLGHAMHSYLRIAGIWEQAISIHRRALAAAGTVGDRRGQANALNDLGIVQRLVGEYHRAAGSLSEALTMYRDLGDRLSQANVLNDLGSLWHLSGEYAAAAASLDEAMSLYRDLGDQQGLANTLNNLGAVRCIAGEYATASAALAEALALYRDLDNPRGEANTLYDLGVVRYLTGEYPTATASLTEALTIYRELGHRRGQATALNGLGRVQYLTGNYAAATSSLTEALNRYRDLGSRLGQAEVLNNLGVVLLRTSETAEAGNHLREALRLARDIHAPIEEARALEGIGQWLVFSGGLEAVEHFMEALTIYERLGVPERERTIATLKELDEAGMR